MMNSRRIYLDNAATTPLNPEVLEAMLPIMQEHFGNPSSSHAHGRKVKGIIEDARGKIAKLLGCSPAEICFTSGGTEADNLALRGSVNSLGIKRIITSPIEHHAVIHTAEDLAHAGLVELVLLDVNEKGEINLNQLADLLQNPIPTLVSLMHANNEIGTMINIQEVGELCHRHNALFHCDTVQTMGHFSFDLSQGYVDFLAAAAHKFNGPKGIGFIYINRKNKLTPEITGGAQEREMRGGTENVYGIVGLAKALEISYRDIEAKKSHIQNLKDTMIQLLQEHIPGIEFNGNPHGDSLYTVLSVSLPPNEAGSMLLFNLDLAGISASGGSACSSGAVGGSHVINACKPGTNRTTIRFSFGKQNSVEDIKYTVENLAKWYAVETA
jgi:cysteine desulfurase